MVLMDGPIASRTSSGSGISSLSIMGCSNHNIVSWYAQLSLLRPLVWPKYLLGQRELMRDVMSIRPSCS